MMVRRSMVVMLLAIAAATAVPVQAQVATTYEVRRGDTLFGIARKTKHDGVSRNQMILAIWRANRNAFPGGDINLLEVGMVLAVPSREVAAAVDPAEAYREVSDLLAGKPPAPAVQVASTAPAATVAKPAGSPEAAMRRYEEGLALERKGDERGALKAFLESGEAGFGLAQRRLGQIYDKGNSAARRDLQVSIFWYQKARAQGVDIDRPIPHVPAITK